MNRKELLKEHYKIADGRRAGTSHKIGSGYSIVIYDHDAICFDSPAKARLELNGKPIKHITAYEPEDLNFNELFTEMVFT